MSSITAASAKRSRSTAAGNGNAALRTEKLELYHDMFAEQTQWRELWTIAARILTGSVIVPNPRTFQTR